MRDATRSARVKRCMREMRRGVATLAVTVLGVAAIGCGDSSGPRSIVAVYALQAVNGKPLPYVFPDSPERRGVSSRRITLFDDRTFTDVEERFEGPVGADRTSSSTSSGRYTIRSSTIELAYPRVEWIITTFEGTLAGEEMTIGYLWAGSNQFRKVP